MGEIRKIYLVHFLAGFSTVASVTLTLYLLSHGLQQFEIAQLFGVFMISLAILEIPTGGLADLFGHKASVASGMFFQAVSFLFFFAYPTYTGFLIGMLFNALGLSLQSGATSSLIYELLGKENLKENFQKVLGRASGFYLMAAIFAGPIGSFIYKYYENVPFLISSVLFLLASLLIFSIKWAFVKKPYKISVYANTIISGIKLTLRSRVLMAVVITGVALTTTRLVFNQNISQPYLVGNGVDIAHLGIVASVVAAAQAFISFNAHKISKKIGFTFSTFLMIAAPSAALIILSMINSLLAIPVILIFVMGHAFRDPVIGHVTHDAVEPDKRATMASTVSFLVSISAGLLLPIWGKGVDVYGLNTTLLLLGVFSLVIGLVGVGLFVNKSSKKV